MDCGLGLYAAAANGSNSSGSAAAGSTCGACSTACTGCAGTAATCTSCVNGSYVSAKTATCVADDAVVIAVVMTLTGVTTATFTPAVQTVFKGAVAEPLGVNASASVIDKISDVARRLAALKQLQLQQRAARQLTGGGVRVDFHVLVDETQAVAAAAQIAATVSSGSAGLVTAMQSAGVNVTVALVSAPLTFTSAGVVTPAPTPAPTPAALLKDVLVVVKGGAGSSDAYVALGIGVAAGLVALALFVRAKRKASREAKVGFDDVDEPIQWQGGAGGPGLADGGNAQRAQLRSAQQAAARAQQERDAQQRRWEEEQDLDGVVAPLAPPSWLTAQAAVDVDGPADPFGALNQYQLPDEAALPDLGTLPPVTDSRRTPRQGALDGGESNLLGPPLWMSQDWDGNVNDI
jgi:hypothetical protein